MDRRVLGAATPVRTFAAVAVLMAAGLTLPAGPPGTGAASPVRPRPLGAWPGSPLRPGPAALRPARPAAAGMVIRLAGPARQASARPGFRMHTLTIKGFSLAGKPDTGDPASPAPTRTTTGIGSASSSRPGRR